MCQYFSCVIDRNFKVWWSPKTMSHEELKNQSGFKDDKLENRDFVGIEILPKDMSKITRARKDWNFKIDEQKTLPAWFTKNQKKAEKKCWDAWAESVKVNLVIGKEKITIKDRFAFALGNSTVEASGNSTVKALGNSTVEALGNSTVKALGNSTVKAWDNSTVEAWDNSTVKALGNSTVKAWDNSTVEAWDNSTVEALGNSTVKASSKSVVRAYNKNVKLCSDEAVVFYPMENRLEFSKKMKVDVVKVEVKP